MINNEIISLGFDCTIARFLKNYGLRFNSYPFDWVVSRNFNLLTSSLINNNLDDFLDVEKIKMYNDYYFVNKQDVEFLHHSKLSIDDFKSTFIKRINRFLDIIKNEEPILFLRKSHDNNNCSKTQKFNEVEECEKFCEYVSQYKQNFKFVLFLSCNTCFNINNSTSSKHLTIIKETNKEVDSNGHYNKDIENYIKNNITI